ncbi:YbaB/EbfC family DNA-binding protein [Asanoa sp. NPDC049518]|uniref:YbaB/EbfC family DNA-binding protein n=1 Tax=unclassified Asanoa TaxID=2685164 RepID=UPI00342F4B53
MTDPSGLINLLSSTAAALGAGSSVTGSASACDGLIVVRAAMPGRITGIRLDPAVAGLPLEELAAELTSAVNAALADLPGSFDVSGDQLRDLQERTSRQFSAFTEALVEAQAALVRRAGEPR